MNKRIKLLADQAEDYATAEYEKWIPTPDFSGIPHIRKIFNEKFAELIVRECYETIKKDMELAHIQLIPIDFGMYANGRLRRIIKEHFGVEE